LPLVSAGFYSKDQILWYAWSATNSNPLLWTMALAGAFITALYSTRLILVVFWGDMKTPVNEYPTKAITVPLITLAVLSVTAGFIEWPHNLVHLTLFSDLIQKVLPAVVLKESLPAEAVFQLIAVAVTLLGVYTGYVLYYHNPAIIEQWKRSAGIMAIRNFLFRGWGFDQLYDAVLVKPFLFITRINKMDVFDRLYNGIAQVSLIFNRLLSGSQNGSLRWYIVGVLIGILFIITLQLIV